MTALHKDILGNEVEVGDRIAYATGTRRARLKLGRVTEKGTDIRWGLHQNWLRVQGDGQARESTLTAAEVLVL